MKRLLLAGLVALVANGRVSAAEASSVSASVRLITLDPGHFHASLVQKYMYDGVDSTVHVYAPAGDDLQEHLKRIERFNTRAEQPTRWQEKVYSKDDFLERMLAEKAGNLVVISGNNTRKTDYILKAVQAGFHVLADKPMAITPADFEKLKLAFTIAASNHVLLYDIMTERFEINSALQRAFSQQPGLFGRLVDGTLEEPAITKESVHHFSKLVAGAPLKRPPWFFDVRQEGEGLVDVATHLVDLVQWEAFPEQILSPSEVSVHRARRWATPITAGQFYKVTGALDFPEFLKPDVKDGVLQVFCNGEMRYSLRGVQAKVSVTWNFEAPPGTGDTHFSIMRGSLANLIIRQGAEQNFKPALYVENVGHKTEPAFAAALRRAVEQVQSQHPGITVSKEGKDWRITVPEKYDVGHESHFAQVTEKFLRYLREGKLPPWEQANMITKYATIMRAYEISR